MTERQVSPRLKRTWRAPGLERSKLSATGGRMSQRVTVTVFVGTSPPKAPKG